MPGRGSAWHQLFATIDHGAQRGPVRSSSALACEIPPLESRHPKASEPGLVADKPASGARTRTHLHLRPDQLGPSCPRMLMHGLHQRDPEPFTAVLREDGEAAQLRMSSNTCSAPASSGRFHRSHDYTTCLVVRVVQADRPRQLPAHDKDKVRAERVFAVRSAMTDRPAGASSSALRLRLRRGQAHSRIVHLHSGVVALW